MNEEKERLQSKEAGSMSSMKGSMKRQECYFANTHSSCALYLTLHLENDRCLSTLSLSSPSSHLPDEK